MNLPTPDVSEKKNWLQKIWKKTKRKIAGLRERLQILREKNPKVFDSFSNCVEVAWVLFCTFCTALTAHYEVKVGASIKLCAKEGVLKTYAPVFDEPVQH